MEPSALVVSNKPVWVRSQDGVFGGVCAGIARALDIEPWIVRLIWLLVVCAFGTGILLYFMLMMTLPRKDNLASSEKKKFLGVCLRISRITGIEVGLVRLMALSSFLLSGGMTLIAYILLRFVLPADQPPRRVVAQGMMQSQV